jgi:hypothetical protein
MSAATVVRTTCKTEVCSAIGLTLAMNDLQTRPAILRGSSERLRCFTNFAPPLRMGGSLAVNVPARGASLGGANVGPRVQEPFMPATGELIRLMNYVDDINATLRRISSAVGTMTAEERKRLSEYMRAATNGLAEVVQQLDKGQ